MRLMSGISTRCLSSGVVLSRWKKSVAGDEDGEAFPPSGVSGGISEGVFPASASIFFAFRAPFPAERALYKFRNGSCAVLISTDAKSAGFCFGVRRAVNEVYRCLEEEKDTPIYTFGPIIHNDEVVNDLKNKGVQVVDTLESLAALKKGIVIIRSHGVGRDTETKMRELGMRVIDMTCPFVKKIHRLVEEKSKEGYQIVIAGNPVHPEVVGIVGWSTDGASVVKDAEEAQKLVLDPKKPVFVAARILLQRLAQQLQISCQ